MSLPQPWLQPWRACVVILLAAVGCRRRLHAWAAHQLDKVADGGWVWLHRECAKTWFAEALPRMSAWGIARCWRPAAASGIGRSGHQAWLDEGGGGWPVALACCASIGLHPREAARSVQYESLGLVYGRLRTMLYDTGTGRTHSAVERGGQAIRARREAEKEGRRREDGRGSVRVSRLWVLGLNTGHRSACWASTWANAATGFVRSRASLDRENTGEGCRESAVWRARSERANGRGV